MGAAEQGLAAIEGAWCWGILSRRLGGAEALVKVGPSQLKPSVVRTVGETDVSFQKSLDLLLRHAYAPTRVEDVRSLEEAESRLALTLPANYKAFLMAADGCETMEPLNRYYFYGLAELPERAGGPHPAQCFPIATDDSDEFAFDLRRNRASASYEVVSYPLSSQAREEVEWVAEDFAEFLHLITRRLGPRREL